MNNISLNTDVFNNLMNIGASLAEQKDMSQLLNIIITKAMEITNCDAGTLYLYDNDVLNFKIMRNHSLKTYKGGNDEPINLPPVPIKEQNVCAYVVIHKQFQNIADVYKSEKFDFAGPKKYDELSGYKTTSMMVIPLVNNKGITVGVLQLINALDEQNNVIPFAKEFEIMFKSIAAQAAIAVTNMQYTKEIKELFSSLVQVLGAAIDERSPYNANHTKNVAHLSSGFIDFINKKHQDGCTDIYFSDELKEQVVMAAWLHDVGKIITPLDIMDKATKLGFNEQLLKMRLDIIYYKEENNYLKGMYTKDEWEILYSKFNILVSLIEKAKIQSIDATEYDLLKTYTLIKTIVNDEDIFWLTDDELECLNIKYGTLTANERIIMQDHVVITKRLLNKIKFTNEYKDVPMLAQNHHEKLNGKGYPQGLMEVELPVAARILTVMDVFEALTSSDRPYKKPMSLEKAFNILDSMVTDGELDKDLVALLKLQQQEKL